jgi:hypothetical protein
VLPKGVTAVERGNRNPVLVSVVALAVEAPVVVEAPAGKGGKGAGKAPAAKAPAAKKK